MLLSFVGIGLVVFPVPIVLGALALRETMRLRTLMCQQWGVPGNIGLSSGSTHLWLWIGGQLLSFIVIGLGLYIAQGIMFLSDHDRRVKFFSGQQSLQNTSGAAVPIARPKPASTGNKPAARFCGECGTALPAGGRFCASCGPKAA